VHIHVIKRSALRIVLRIPNLEIMARSGTVVMRQAVA